MNYANRIQRLRDRRAGVYSKSGEYNAQAALTAVLKAERFLGLAEGEAVKYAIGAMQPVDPDYTRTSYEEGNRVRDRLIEGLTAVSIPATFEYQGSVPLDVHVHGNSDVDLLVMHGGFVTASVGARSLVKYTDQPGPSPLDELMTLRKECEAILLRRYYAAKVDVTSGKAIKLSGGSLQRAIDVVPAHWHDTADWCATREQRHRDVYVLDRKVPERVANKPFMHIAQVKDKCARVSGALRKVVRLLKNLRYDADPQIGLSGYDIAALAWHMSEGQLSVPFGVDLLLVERARLHLQQLLQLPHWRDNLLVPDGSRKIFDVPSKVTELRRLYLEVECLAADVVQAIDPVGYAHYLGRESVLSKRAVAM